LTRADTERLDNCLQRLMGASLLVFANKQDIRGAMSSEEIEQVRLAGNRHGTPDA
jgi:signal recognition particle receptor subunit beta